MFAKYLAAALIGSALIASPAIAQTSNSKSSPQQEQNASATSEWRGSKLVGVNVYNDQNEKIGDIKELMVDKSGKIDKVVIGVGGFLGAGEHDVAVKFSDLKFSDEPVRGTTGSSATSSRSKRNYPDHAVFNTSKDQLKSMPQFDYNK